MTPNQLVAMNLKRARRLRELKQEEAAERIEPFLGTKWSKAVFSSAERSVDGKRIRPFDADEIVAFAHAFDLPVAWFFLPDDDDPDPDLLARLVGTGDATFGRRLSSLLGSLPKSGRKRLEPEGMDAKQAASLERKVLDIQRRLDGLRDEIAEQQTNLRAVAVLRAAHEREGGSR